MSEEPKFIAIIDDRLWKSIMRDIVTLASLVFACGVGVVIGSVALQWFGGSMLVLVGLLKMINFTKDNRMTITKAREYLDKLESSQ